MARKVDDIAQSVYDLEETRRTISDLRREIYKLEKEEQFLEALILHKMQNSTEATINGVPVFEVAMVDPQQRITKDRVLEVCPQYLTDLLNDPNKKPKKKIKFFKKGK